MSAATSLPWFQGLLNRATLTQWRVSADRLSANQLTGINYPRPDQVALLCETLINAIDATQEALTDRNAHDDAEDLLESIETLSEAAKDAAKEASRADDAANAAEQAQRTAEDRADELDLRAEQAEKERDALQRQLDASEAQVKRLTAYLVTIREVTDAL